MAPHLLGQTHLSPGGDGGVRLRLLRVPDRLSALARGAPAPGRPSGAQPGEQQRLLGAFIPVEGACSPAGASAAARTASAALRLLLLPNPGHFSGLSPGTGLL